MEPLTFAQVIRLTQTQHTQLRIQVDIDGQRFVPGNMRVEGGQVIWDLREGRTWRKLVNVFSEAKNLKAPEGAGVTVVGRSITAVELKDGKVILMTAA